MAVRHIGLICPEISGHLNPMTTLGRELLRRGHRVSLIGIAGAGQVVPLAGLRTAVQQVLSEPRYRERAVDVRRQIQALNGVRRAADSAEQALSTRQPVLRADYS